MKTCEIQYETETFSGEKKNGSLPVSYQGRQPFLEAKAFQTFLDAMDQLQLRDQPDKPWTDNIKTVTIKINK